MLWLLVTIFCYFVFAFVFLVDKYLLSSSIQEPKIYVFYVGALSVLAVLFIPFVAFSVPSFCQTIFALFAGAFFIYALFWFYRALQSFEVSRVVPVISGLTPFFTLAITYIFSLGRQKITPFYFLAFCLLVLGSVLMVSEKGKKIKLKKIKIPLFASFLLALSFVFLKYVYLELNFWSAFIWTKIGSFLIALVFILIWQEVRQGVFRATGKVNKKTALIFLLNQTAGAGANILQNLAVFLVPLGYLAFVNALQGVQYVFLFLFSLFLSLRFPQILKERVSREIIIQKSVAVLSIGLGLAALAFGGQ